MGGTDDADIIRGFTVAEEALKLPKPKRARELSDTAVLGERELGRNSRLKMTQASRERKICLQRIAESPECSLAPIFAETKTAVSTRGSLPSTNDADTPASASARVEIDTSDEMIGATGNEPSSDDDVDEWVSNCPTRTYLLCNTFG